MKSKYNDIEVLNQADPMDILNLIVDKKKADFYKYIIQEYYNHKHQVQPGVINATLIYALCYTESMGSTFNVSYLRKVMETFKRRGVTTTHLANEFLEHWKKHVMPTLNSQKSCHIVRQEPVWFKEFMDDLEKDGW